MSRTSTSTSSASSAKVSAPASVPALSGGRKARPPAASLVSSPESPGSREILSAVFVQQRGLCHLRV